MQMAAERQQRFLEELEAEENEVALKNQAKALNKEKKRRQKQYEFNLTLELSSN